MAKAYFTNDFNSQTHIRINDSKCVENKKRTNPINTFRCIRMVRWDMEIYTNTHRDRESERDTDSDSDSDSMCTVIHR